MILVRMLSRLPLWILYLVSDFLFILSFHVFRYRRRQVWRNLKNAFPEKTDKYLRGVERQFYRNLCDYAVEMLKLVTIGKEELDRRVTFSNPEVANRYLEQGQSTLNLASHTFNWEWMLTAGSFKLKGAMDFVYQPVHSKFFNELSLLCRTKFGAYPIRRDAVAREIVKRKGVVRNVAIVGDQYPGYPHDKKFPITFMNQETVFFYGSVQLAVLTQYPVFYYRMRKMKRGYYEASIVELGTPPYGANDKNIIERYVKSLEELIRENPSEWLWSHDRWKTRHLGHPSSVVKV
jgi:KDO2-lipid IV(A) lauroyltransferase